MILPNRENDNSDKTQKKDRKNIAKERYDKIHYGLNILAGIIARDIYNKRKSNSSDK